MDLLLIFVLLITLSRALGIQQTANDKQISGGNKYSCASIFLLPPHPCETLTVLVTSLITVSPPDEVYVLIVTNPLRHIHSKSTNSSNVIDTARYHMGRLIDAFIQTKPFWIVRDEHSHSATLIRISDPFFLDLLSTITHIQYPPPALCAQRHIIVRSFSFGFSEYGNEYSNFCMTYESAMGAIYDVYAPLGNSSSFKGIAFLDPDYCPFIINKWTCAFIPATNCSWPSQITSCDGTDRGVCATYGEAAFDRAMQESNQIDRDKLAQSPLRDSLRRMVASSSYTIVRSKRPGDFSTLSSRSEIRTHGLPDVFPILILMRLNHDFRQRVNQQISRFQRASNPHFGFSASCIAVHIRHHDRQNENLDILKFCREFIRHPNETCTNSSTGETIHHCGMGIDLDYGCNTAIPFGAISFEHYIKAATSLLSPGQPKNMFVITDDGKWVRQESRLYRKEWNIYSLPAPPNHRLPSNFNGANVFASFQLAQQCSGFVGHMQSAFAQLIFQYMCLHHKEDGKSVFRSCPKTFDFKDVDSN